MLPPHIARIFLPRPPLRYLPPTDVEPTKRKLPYVTGLGAYVDLLGKEDPDMPAYVPTKSHEQLRSERVYKSEGGVMGFDFTRACTFLKIARKTAEAEANRKRQQEEYNPKAKTEGKTIDPFKTLFVARLVCANVDGVFCLTVHINVLRTSSHVLHSMTIYYTCHLAFHSIRTPSRMRTRYDACLNNSGRSRASTWSRMCSLEILAVTLSWRWSKSGTPRVGVYCGCAV